MHKIFYMRMNEVPLGKKYLNFKEIHYIKNLI